MSSRNSSSVGERSNRWLACSISSGVQGPCCASHATARRNASLLGRMDEPVIAIPGPGGHYACVRRDDLQGSRCPLLLCPVTWSLSCPLLLLTTSVTHRESPEHSRFAFEVSQEMICHRSRLRGYCSRDPTFVHAHALNVDQANPALPDPAHPSLYCLVARCYFVPIGHECSRGPTHPQRGPPRTAKS